MRLILTAVLLAGIATPAAAQSLHQYSALALSPRGDEIAAIEAGEGAGHGAIVLRAVRDGRVLRTIDPCARCNYSGLTYAPDGSLVFLARDRVMRTATLSQASAGTVRTIATIRGLAQSPRVAPDGTRVALLVTLGAAKEAGATQAGVRQVGEIGERSDEQRLAVFPLAGPAIAANAVRPVSPAGRYVYEYDWTPDSRGIVATTALGNGDNNWWVATLDAIDATTGAVRQIAKPTVQLNFPRVSPDGRSVAYVGGLMSDFGSVGGDVFTVPFAGGTATNVTARRPLTVTSLDWTRAGLRGTSLKGADAGVIAPTEAKRDGVLWSRPVGLTAGDGRAAFSADGSIVATIVQDFSHAPAIYAGPVAAPRQITHDNDAVQGIATARSIDWKNDGYAVQGWLLAPRGADATVRAPMIVVVHGGPAAATTPSFVAPGGFIGDLLAAGYYVFQPNPRGSYGQGEAFTAANKRDFGGGDLRDILAGVDAAIAAAPVDGKRLGLMGGSYGGFMAMWANTQTDRFKGIIAGAGLSNWISYYGTNGIDQWMLPFFGKSMYDDPQAYEDVSAIYRMKKARTPTFIYVGERDIEVPPTQSIEYWHALKDQGVATSLVIYPDEGHSIRDAGHAADLRRRGLAWFDRYVKGVK